MEEREREDMLEALDELTESPGEALAREAMEAAESRERESLPEEVRQEADQAAREEPREEAGSERDPEPDLRHLAAQAQWLMTAQGVDMVEILREEPGLLTRVARGEMDMHQAYIEHLSRLERDEGAMPPAIRGGAGRAVVDIRKLSPEKMREIEERLGRGERIAIE